MKIFKGVCWSEVSRHSLQKAKHLQNAKAKITRKSYKGSMSIDMLFAGLERGLSMERGCQHIYPSQFFPELIDNENAVPFIRQLYSAPFPGGPFSTRRNPAGEIGDVYSETAARLSREY